MGCRQRIPSPAKVAHIHTINRNRRLGTETEDGNLMAGLGLAAREVEDRSLNPIGAVGIAPPAQDVDNFQKFYASRSTEASA